VTEALYIDTSAWYPLADPAHPEHERLAATLKERVQRGTRIVTSNLVLAETYVLLLRRAGRDVALTFLQIVRQPPNSIEHSTGEREQAALRDWLMRFEDQDFSLTDAVSFAIMTELGIRDALTLDRHFATAGFVVVPPNAS
jgi:predicted nucleic acid-binding protein